PLGNRWLAHPPPVTDGRGTFLLYGAGEFLVHDQFGSPGRLHGWTAARPGDRRIAPARHDQQAIPDQAHRATSTAKRGRGVGAAENRRGLPPGHRAASGKRAVRLVAAEQHRSAAGGRARVTAVMLAEENELAFPVHNTGNAIAGASRGTG